MTTATTPLCEVCDWPLDGRGQCSSCAGVTDRDLDNVSHAFVYWVVCSAHGANEVGRAQQYCATWKERDPKDGRRKITKHQWLYRCPKCPILGDNMVQSFKERILLPRESYQGKWEARLRRWNDLAARHQEKQKERNENKHQ